MDEPLVDTLPDYSEAEVDEAIKEKDLFLDPVVIPERAESKTKRRRRTRVRYTDDEILQMSLHLAKQMELTPRPAMVEVWTAYVAQYPDCDRTVSALLQEYNRHPDLFGSAFNKPLGVEPPPESTPLDTVQITYSDPLPPWDEEDQEILVDFLRQHQPVQAHHWDELHGKSARRPLQSFRIKYYKGKRAYDELVRGTASQPFKAEAETITADALVAETTEAVEVQSGEAERVPFTWQLPSGYRKRPRSPTTLIPTSPRQRRKSASRTSYLEESPEPYDSGDDYRGARASTSAPTRKLKITAGRKSAPELPLLHEPPKASTASSSTIPPLRITVPPARPSQQSPLRPSPTIPAGPTSRSTTLVAPSLPAWLSEFTPKDKAAALQWVISRQRPGELMDNFESWIEFAAIHPEHTAPEWLCYYLVHLPTFDAVETNMGFF